MKSNYSFSLILIAGAMLATNPSLRGADANSTSEASTPQPASGAESKDAGPHYDQTSYYRSGELSLDGFGTASLGSYTIDHPSNNQVRQNTEFGAGAGANFFITRNIGIGGEVYSENTGGTFIDNASGNLILRLPLGQSGFAPYAFGGGGHQFDQAKLWFGQAGAGLEFRFTPHVGLFLDARMVWPNETKYYGVARLGVRVSF